MSEAYNELLEAKIQEAQLFRVERNKTIKQLKEQLFEDELQNRNTFQRQTIMGGLRPFEPDGLSTSLYSNPSGQNSLHYSYDKRDY